MLTESRLRTQRCKPQAGDLSPADEGRLGSREYGKKKQQRLDVNNKGEGGRKRKK